MIKIGIIGAENSHTIAISKTLNIQKKIRGCRILCVWGETPKYAKKAQIQGEIPEIVKKPEDMIGNIDAAIVDHRHPKFHLPAARSLLEAKIPLFIDKPFCYKTLEGKKFLARAQHLKVPVTSFSVLPKQASFGKLKKKVHRLGQVISVISTGPSDIKSKFGGIFFYGIHQVDMVLRILGQDVTHVQLNQGRQKVHTATLYSANGAVSTINLVAEGHPSFHVSVIGERGRVDQNISYDANPYLSGIRSFCQLFRTGKTDETNQTILMPVAVLEGLETSLKRKKKAKVASL